MRRVVRRPLSEATRQHLADRQAQVDAESGFETQVKKAKAFWDSKKKSQAGQVAFTEVEDALVEMCNAPRRCMYCEDSEAWDIEHVRPKAGYPQDAFRWNNYLLACSTCNTRFKGSQYHEGFLDPSTPGFRVWNRWRFDPRTGHYLALHNDEGADATLKILGFDRRVDLAVRRSRYLGPLIDAVRLYGKTKKMGKEEEAKKIARDFCLSFPAIVEWLLVEDPSPDDVPSGMRAGLGDVRKVKSRYPEIVRDAFGADD